MNIEKIKQVRDEFVKRDAERAANLMRMELSGEELTLELFTTVMEERLRDLTVVVGAVCKELIGEVEEEKKDAVIQKEASSS